MLRVIVLLLGITALSESVCAQDSTSAEPTPFVKPAWFASRDLSRMGLGFVGIGLSSLADERVAKLSQKAFLHNKPIIQHSANFAQTAGHPGALMTSVSLYVIGSAAHRPGLADAGLHSAEAIAVSGAITHLLKRGVGRARPNVVNDTNAYVFHLLHGNQTDYNSFPSGHTTAAFAAATVRSAEASRLHPGQRSAAAPALYGVATLVGASRIYNDRHWLSDVVAGALIGHFVGKRITSHAHARP